MFVSSERACMRAKRCANYPRGPGQAQLPCPPRPVSRVPCPVSRVPCPVSRVPCPVSGVVVREVGGRKILLKCKQSNEPGSGSLGHGQGDEHANVQSGSASSGDGQEHQFAMFQAIFQRDSPISRLAGESFQ